MRLLKSFFTRSEDDSEITTSRRMLLSSADSYHVYEYDVPKQVQDYSEKEELEKASETTQNFLLTQFILTVTLNLFLSGAFK